MAVYPDRTPPGPVTGLAVEPEDGAVTLTWINPTDPDFVGVIVRRSTSGYPDGPADGDLLIDARSGETAVDDTGLTNGTEYFYAAFAYDAEAPPNHSTAAHATAIPGYAFFVVRDNPIIHVGSGESAVFYLNFPTERRVTVTVYSLRGQVVRDLTADLPANPVRTATITWDASNARGRRVGSGVYFVKATADGPAQKWVRKIVVVR